MMESNIPSDTIEIQDVGNLINAKNAWDIFRLSLELRRIGSHLSNKFSAEILNKAANALKEFYYERKKYRPTLNHERFSDWDEAYEAWKKEANPPHPDSVAYTEQGCAMKMVWLFAKWLYEETTNEKCGTNSQADEIKKSN